MTSLRPSWREKQTASARRCARCRPRRKPPPSRPRPMRAPPSKQANRRHASRAITARQNVSPPVGAPCARPPCMPPQKAKKWSNGKPPGPRVAGITRLDRSRRRIRDGQRSDAQQQGEEEAEIRQAEEQDLGLQGSAGC